MSDSETQTLVNAFCQVNDEKIKAAIQNLSAAGLSITIAKITDQSTDCIVDSYDNTTSLFTYKSNWCVRISNILFESKMTYGKSRPNWENISMLINDRRIGVVHPRNEQFRNFSSTVENALTTTSANSVPAYLNSSSNVKLTLIQKDAIKCIFNGIKEEDIWKLSTGTIVEKKMELFALECNYEHPVHYVVLDVSDRTWLKYFTMKEIKEIKSYNSKEVVGLPAAMKDYIKGLRQCQHVAELKSPLKSDSSDPGCKWVRAALLQFIHLFKCRYLPLATQSEGDLMRRVWTFNDTAFVDFKIDRGGGEKASDFSFAGRIADRVISEKDKVDNKKMGRKVELLFSRKT